MAGYRRIVEQFYDRFGDGDLDAAIAMFSMGIRITDPGLGTVEGLDELRSYLVELKGAVPDARAVVERVFEYRTYYDQVSLLDQLGQTE